MTRIFVPLLALALVACSDREGTSVSINAADGEGAPATVSADGDTGRVAINVPGFKADVQLPKIRLDADNFDINGLKLFPGATIEGVNLDAAKGDGGDVRVRFDAPAAATAVRDHFERQMRDAGFQVRVGDNGLTGLTDKGEPFTLQLRPGADGHTIGELNVSADGAR